MAPNDSASFDVQTQPWQRDNVQIGTDVGTKNHQGTVAQTENWEVLQDSLEAMISADEQVVASVCAHQFLPKSHQNPTFTQ